MRWVVIVNGPPGTGKSTLAPGLATALAVPMFSKDTVKEVLLDRLGFADRDASRRIGAASGELLWTLLRDCSTPALIESWLAPSTRDVVRAGLARASVDRVVEVWCSCPPELARARFLSRERHRGHFDADLVPDLDLILSGAEPLGVGDVVRVSTQAPVDIPALSHAVLELVRSPSPGTAASGSAWSANLQGKLAAPRQGAVRRSG